MSKVEIQGDVGQVFSGDVQQVHIHCQPPQRDHCGAFLLWALLMAAGWAGLKLVFDGAP